jgi:hypothetical protein
MFESGEKVVCVDDSPGWRGPVPLAKGNIYIVRGLCWWDGDDIPAVRLIGVYMDLHPIANEEYGFHPLRFRRLSDMQQEARERRKQDQPIEV